MIRYFVVNANIEMDGFDKDRKYFCRQSKDGNQILVRNSMGKWVMFTNKRFTMFWTMLSHFEKCFTVVEKRYAKDYKELRKKVGSLG